MIEPLKFESPDFSEVFETFENMYVEELTTMMIDKLFEEKTLSIPGIENEILEFAGRTNYKIRLKRPNKNVWSIPLQDIRDSIKKVLREGKLLPVEGKPTAADEKNKNHNLPLNWLLHILPEDEYRKRSFVGNIVQHPTLGEGEMLRITDSGNVEVKFAARTAMLKPNFIQLKLK